MNAQTRGTLIREARLARGYKQKDMAEMLSISQQAYSTIESDAITNPRRIILKRIAEILDIPFESLLLGTGWNSDQPSEAAQSVARAYDTLPHDARIQVMAVILELQRTTNTVNRVKDTSET